MAFEISDTQILQKDRDVAMHYYRTILQYTWDYKSLRAHVENKDYAQTGELTKYLHFINSPAHGKWFEMV